MLHKPRRPANDSNKTRDDSAARRVFGPMVAAGAAVFLRARDLPKLALWPHELADESLKGGRLVLAKLRRALRGRTKARAGRPYDLNRHVGLLSAYRGEQAGLAKTVRGTQPNCTRRAKGLDGG